VSISERILPEFDLEAAAARKVLERVPEGKNDWRPHDKSMPLGRLATHVAELPEWAKNAIVLEELDFAPPGSGEYKPHILESRAEMLAVFDKNVAEARAAIAGASDEELDKPWALKMGGEILFSSTKYEVLRRWALNHLVHHRAQLGVYLRLNEIAVPPAFGPTADETGM